MKTLRWLVLGWTLAAFGSQVLAQTTITIAATDANAAETLPGQPTNPGSIRIARTGSTTSALIVYFKSISGTAVRGAVLILGCESPRGFPSRRGASPTPSLWAMP